MHSLLRSPTSRLRDISTPCWGTGLPVLFFSPVPRQRTGALAFHVCSILPCKEELSPSKRLITSAETKSACTKWSHGTWQPVWQGCPDMPANKQKDVCIPIPFVKAQHTSFFASLSQIELAHMKIMRVAFFFFPLMVHGDYSSATSSFSAA